MKFLPTNPNISDEIQKQLRRRAREEVRRLLAAQRLLNGEDQGVDFDVAERAGIGETPTLVPDVDVLEAQLAKIEAAFDL